jgi:gliding motility-associated-like protein
MTGATGSGNYSAATWTGGAALGTWTQNANPALATFTPTVASGSFIATLTLTGSNGCGNVADTRTITWGTTPVVDAGLDITACSGLVAIAMTGATASGTYSAATWTGGAALGTWTQNANPALATFTPSVASGSFTATLTLTGSNGCGNVTDTRTIIWGTAPTADAGLDITTCTGLAAIAMTGATASGTYSAVTWTGGAGLGSWTQNANPALATFTPTVASGSFTATLTLTGTNGCSNATDTRVITWGTAPTTDAGLDITSCTGLIAIAMTGATASGTYSAATWTGGAGLGLWTQNANPALATFTPTVASGSFTATLTLTGSNGCGNVTDTRTITWGTIPLVEAGLADSVCYTSTSYLVGGASASNYSTLQWSIISGSGTWVGGITNVLNPTYNFGVLDYNSGNGSLVRLQLQANGVGACASSFARDTLDILLAPEVRVSIGSPAPFYISPNTEIKVCLSTSGHQRNLDMGYYLMAPDGSTIMPLKKGPQEFNFFSPCIPVSGGVPGDVTDLCFTTELPSSDTLNVCTQPRPMTGTYAATGDWSTFYGMNPAEGGWAVVVKDTANNRPTVNDGNIIKATLTFIDTATATGHLRTINYISGAITIPIIEQANTAYLIPRGLQVSCAGECDAIGLVNTIGGMPPYTNYQWSPAPVGGNGTDSVVFCAGTYNLTVTDAMGCTGSTSVVVSEPPAILINTFNSTDTLSCFGNTTGSITVTATGGTGSLEYTLLPGNIASETPGSGTFTNLPAGTYTVHIEDINACYIDTTVVIHQQPQLVLVSAAVTNSVYCVGDLNGQITAVASGGTPPYSFILEPGTITNSTGIFDNLGPGSYVVSVTDANSCDTISSNTLIIGVPVPLEIDTVLVEPILCFGDSGRIGIVVNGGSRPYAVSLTGGPDSIPIPFDLSYLSLQPDSIEGKDAEIVDWAPDGAHPSTAKLHARAWTFSSDPVIVRGLLSFDLASIPTGTIIDSARLSLYSYISDIGGHSTLSGSNASLLQRITTDWPETVTWNTRPLTTTQNEVTLPASTIAVQHYPNIDVTALLQDMVDEPDSSFGFLLKLITEEYYRAMIFASSDNPDSTLHPKLDVYYNEPGADTIFFDVPAGNYDIVLYDANGCSVSWPTTISLTNPPAIVMDSILITPITTCYTDPVGEIDVYASGGTGAIEYSIDGINFQTANEFTGLTGGNYTVFIRDANSCIITIDTLVASPPQLLGNPIVTHVEGENLGSIQLNPTGGTPYTVGEGYRYSIDGGPLTTESLFDNLDAGSYLVHVEDSLGCPWDSTIIIGVIDLDITVVAFNADCYGDPSGEIRVYMNDGTAPYTVYLNGLVVYANEFNDFVIIGSVYPGTYLVGVEDDASRYSDTTVVVNSPPPLGVQKDLGHVSCNEYNYDGSAPSNGHISYNADGGAGGYEYSWQDTSNPDSIRLDLPVGTYIVTVTDRNGCTQIDSTTLVALDTIAAEINIYPEDPNGVMTTAELLTYPSPLDDTLCYLSNWHLLATNNYFPVIYTWSPDTLLDDPGDNLSPDVTFTIMHPLQFYLKINNTRCMDLDTIRLFVHDTMNMQIETDGYRVRDSIFDPLGKPLNLFGSEGYSAYEWLASDDFDDYTLQNTVLTPLTDQLVIVIGTTPAGCYEPDTVYIVIQQPLNEIADVFTPNGDQRNDYWIIPYALQYPDLEVFIFNRWGQQVFYSSPYGTDEQHTWDGTSQKNGKDLPIGSYYYIIKPNDGEQEPLTGTVTIVR